jgi:predicted phage-related endonuclease
MATRDKLYELIYEKLSDWFRTGKTASDLPPKVKAAVEKDPKIKKQLKKVEKAAADLEKTLDKALKIDY